MEVITIYREPWKTYFFPSKRIEPPDKYTLWRQLAKDLSPEARLGLKWFIFYETAGQRKASQTAAHFGIFRKTFHKWRKRFKESQEKPQSLENQSRAPKKKRHWEVTREEESRIITLRRKHLKYGKKKLKVIYLREYHKKVSTWKIERVIRRWQLYPDKVEQAKRLKRKARRAKNKEINP